MISRIRTISDTDQASAPAIAASVPVRPSLEAVRLTRMVSASTSVGSVQQQAQVLLCGSRHPVAPSPPPFPITIRSISSAIIVSAVRS